jgi:outer membrane protein assembly factor BamB
MVSLDLATGETRWRREGEAWLAGVRNLVYYKGVVACEISTLSNTREGNNIELVLAADGKSAQNRQFLPATSHYQQAWALFVDGLLWTQSLEGWTGGDWRSGEIKHVFPSGSGHCFPPVATVRYLLAGEMHLTDLRTGLVDINPITKGNCSRDGGFMPANGLIYTAPKHCICWPMLRGYTALAPAGKVVAAAAHVRLRGPAAAPAAAPTNPSTDWPSYRHDAWRSGGSTVSVPAELKIRWSRTLGDRPRGGIADDWRDDPYVRGPITAPVIAGGKVFVARPDAHELVALDEERGEECWRFTADGRIDTPPTIHRGLCLFGTSSGFVYCLRADDGGLVWRFRAAPVDERIVVYGQVESPWPVPGSVLVVDDVAYVAAGRHSLADGGIRVFALQPATGNVIWSRRLDSVPQKNFYDSTGLEFDNFDLLHLEGQSVAMSRWLFDRQTGQMTCLPKSGFARLVTGGSGVVAPRGFWSYAPRNESEHNLERPFVRPLLSFRDNRLFGMSEDRKTVFRRDFDLTGGEDFDEEWFKGWTIYADARKGGDLWRTQRLARGAQWSVPALGEINGGQRGGAMALAANALLVASQQGGLAVLSLEEGKLVSRLEIPPVAWDGLAISGSGVFVSTQEGQVLCLGGK